MSSRPRKLIAIDAETDPFKRDRVPQPFVWGTFDGEQFLHFPTAQQMVDHYADTPCFMYAHNGGKFDFHLMLDCLPEDETRVRIINSRIVEMTIGKILLRDSLVIITEALSKFKKDNIEYWKFEADVRGVHMEEIISYLKGDCTYLYELLAAFFLTAGNKLTLGANAITFVKKQGIDPGKTSHRYDRVFRDFYFGGRVECFDSGLIEDINVYDIKSSYPHAMLYDHPTGSEFIVDDTLGPYDEYIIARSFIDITCFSKGAFPLSEKTGLRFPHMLGRFKVTGWEYLTAKKHGLISGERINEIYIHAEYINFAPFIEHWFKHKNDAKERGDKAQYSVAKYMMCALYGKLAQNPIHYYDYKICSSGSEVDYENGWQLGVEFRDKEIHERSVLWKYQAKYGDDWVKFPIHYNVATGASITGFARAALLDAIHSVGERKVVYCDTDCIFARDGAKTSALRQDGKLGAWDWEGFTGKLYLAGKKMYALKFTNGPKTGETKLANKGAHLAYEEIARIALGETGTWHNDAPTFSLGKEPKFMVRSIRSTAMPERR